MLILWAAIAVWVVVDRFWASTIFPNSDVTPHSAPTDVNLSFIEYTDADFGFSMLVPQHWTVIHTDSATEEWLDTEPGYSVVFESPSQGEGDIYADYIMVEVLPGIETGAFESSGERRQVVIIDGQKAVQDQITLMGFPFENTELDLSVWQAEIAQLGYTVGLYAIGTHNNARMLEDAFQALVHSFQLPKQPYLVTELF